MEPKVKAEPKEPRRVKSAPSGVTTMLTEARIGFGETDTKEQHMKHRLFEAGLEA